MNPAPRTRPTPDPPGVDPLAIVSQEQAHVWLGISIAEQRAARRAGTLPYRRRGIHIQYLRRELDRYLSAQFGSTPLGPIDAPTKRPDIVTADALNAALGTSARHHAHR